MYDENTSEITIITILECKVCARYRSFIVQIWQRKQQWGRICCQTNLSDLSALNWTERFLRIKRSFNNIFFFFMQQPRSPHIILKTSRFSNVVITFVFRLLAKGLLSDYFIREHIMCIHSHREYECSPICNFPMILIFISSLYSASR